jgi:hypothetical protein
MIPSCGGLHGAPAQPAVAAAKRGAPRLRPTLAAGGEQRNVEFGSAGISPAADEAAPPDLPMSGERDLHTLLRDMRPVLDEAPYVIASVPAASLPAHPTCLGLFHEPEGVTLILTAAEAERLSLPTAPQWAHSVLSVHSSLLAVGFLASVATALAAAGISVNPVAGYYHDHLFVPWSARHQALAVLRQLAQARPSGTEFGSAGSSPEAQPQGRWAAPKVDHHGYEGGHLP